MSQRKLTDEIKKKMIALREKHGLTHYALSQRFGISVSVIEHALSGVKRGETHSPDCR